jgi:amidase
VAIEDVTPTAGIRTTYGSTLFEDHVPAEDALVVQRLRAAGAIVLGRTNTPEFAFGAPPRPSRRRSRGPAAFRLSSRGSDGGWPTFGNDFPIVSFSGASPVEQ